MLGFLLEIMTLGKPIDSYRLQLDSLKMYSSQGNYLQ